MTNQLMISAVVVALGFPVAAHALSNGDYKNMHERIDAQYRSDQQKCNDLAGNTKDVCLTQAKGTEKVAKAELDARRENYTAQARYDLRLAKAEATHEIAKEKCDDKAGNAKDVCMKDARAALTRTKTEAGADRKASETSQASREKVANVTREADYDAAVERCDTYAGEAKTRCVADTKARFGVK